MDTDSQTDAQTIRFLQTTRLEKKTTFLISARTRSKTVLLRAVLPRSRTRGQRPAVASYSLVEDDDIVDVEGHKMTLVRKIDSVIFSLLTNRVAAAPHWATTLGVYRLAFLQR